jgi:hypothetical protein
MAPIAAATNDDNNHTEDDAKEHRSGATGGTEEAAATVVDERQRTIAYLLFGIDLNEAAASASDQEKKTPAKKDAVDHHHHPVAGATRIKSMNGATTATDTRNKESPQIIDEDNELDGALTTSSALQHPKVKNALDEIDRHIIPTDRDALRHSSIFLAALPALQWQRDSYLVGSEYADWRQRQRPVDDKEHRPPPPPSPIAADSDGGGGGGVLLALQRRRRQRQAEEERRRTMIPYDPTALVHGQLRPLLVDFLPSETVVQALTPIVAALPLQKTFLYDPIAQSTIDLIRSQRPNLDWVVKDQLLRNVLTDPVVRHQMKASMQGLMIPPPPPPPTPTTPR